MSDELAINTEGITTCPYCADNVPTLIPIETGMRLRLQQNAEIGNIPDAVCEGCLKQMSKMVLKGAALRAEAKAKEQNRLLLWKNRVSLVKQGKALLSQKNYADAAVSFEKYIRVLEIVYDLESGSLTPAIISNDGRKQELTVVASVYWDLMRVYDSNPRYADRQMGAATKLAEFVRFTPLYPYIVRRAESLARTGRNPEAFRKFLQLSNAKRPRCFIATAAFNGQRSPAIETLCLFRDEFLKRFAMGRALVVLYYRISPGFADFLDRHPQLKPAVRLALRTTAQLLTFCAFTRKRLNP